MLNSGSIITSCAPANLPPTVLVKYRGLIHIYHPTSQIWQEAVSWHFEDLCMTYDVIIPIPSQLYMVGFHNTCVFIEDSLI